MLTSRSEEIRERVGRDVREEFQENVFSKTNKENTIVGEKRRDQLCAML